MIPLSRRTVLAIAAVVDIAIHGRAGPVPAKHLAARHDLPPRHLETLLQALVREGILKGLRGPRGGYELGRDRRHITAGEITRAATSGQPEEALPPMPSSALVDRIVTPVVETAIGAFIARLDAITLDQLCREAEEVGVFETSSLRMTDFTI